ncbi:putative transcription factor B3-Domain family [Helianthus anomalus]
MSFNNRGGGASFFKILLRDSVDRLPLPPAYARKYLETSSSNMKKQMVVVLKIKSGVKWSVTYSKIRDKYYFMDGWLKFMKDNRLQMGVFLVFWRLSPSVFQVSVYGPNGCLKQPTVSHVSNRKTPFVNEDVYDDDDDSSENVQQKKMISVVKSSYLHKMPLKKHFVEAIGIKGYSSLQLRNDEGKIWNVKLNLFKYGLNRFMQISTGWHDFRKHNKIETGNTCEFYHVKSNLLHVRVLTAKRGNMRQAKLIEWMSKR